MYGTITSIELKSPFKFFPLSLYALHIMRQYKNTPGALDFKKTGVWTMHYTMTLWEDKQSIRNFASSGAHLEAMKNGSKIAKEIRVLTIAVDKLPNWKEAKLLLKRDGKSVLY